MKSKNLHNTEPIEFTINDPELDQKITELEYQIEHTMDSLKIREYRHELSVLQGLSKSQVVKYETSYSHTCGVYFEHSISCYGYSYLVIFGYHINGAYICVPNWSIGCEASDHLYSIGYNQAKLENAGLKPGAALAIATYIDRWLLENQEKLTTIRQGKVE